MNLSDRRLLKHLGWAVALKLVVLTALWWAFIREARVPVDSERAALHLLPPSTSSSSPEGASK